MVVVHIFLNHRLRFYMTKGSDCDGNLAAQQRFEPYFFNFVLAEGF